MRSARQHGFTLVELMMTIAVFVVLTLIALPYLGTFIQSQRVKNAAMDITSTVNFARSEAIKRNARVDIVANASGWAGGWQVQSSGTSLRSYGTYGDLSVAAKHGSTELSFGGDGRMVTSAESFQLQPAQTGSRQGPLCVAVGTSGHVTTSGGQC